MPHVNNISFPENKDVFFFEIKQNNAVSMNKQIWV